MSNLKLYVGMFDDILVSFFYRRHSFLNYGLFLLTYKIPLTLARRIRSSNLYSLYYAICITTLWCSVLDMLQRITEISSQKFVHCT